VSGRPEPVADHEAVDLLDPVERLDRGGWPVGQVIRRQRRQPGMHRDPREEVGTVLERIALAEDRVVVQIVVVADDVGQVDMCLAADVRQRHAGDVSRDQEAVPMVIDGHRERDGADPGDVFRVGGDDEPPRADAGRVVRLRGHDHAGQTPGAPEHDLAIGIALRPVRVVLGAEGPIGGVSAPGDHDVDRLIDGHVFGFSVTVMSNSGNP
jgi:hypothetical protein